MLVFSQNNEGKFIETKFATTEVRVYLSGTMVHFVIPEGFQKRTRPPGNPIHPLVRAVSAPISTRYKNSTKTPFQIRMSIQRIVFEPL